MRVPTGLRWAAALAFAILMPGPSRAASSDHFGVRVVDAETSRGIPLVRVRIAGTLDLYTDSAGWIAFQYPGLMDRKLSFAPASHGYRYDAPDLAMGGAGFETKPGTTATLVMQRNNIAERLYRVTGPGIYGDSIKLGLAAPIKHPLLNSGVFGQDSVATALHKGRLFWIWGDTSSGAHPLAANFRGTGAWSELPPNGGLPADTGVNLDYITSGTFTRPMGAMDHGENRVYWFSGLASVPDHQGTPHLVANYARIAMPGMVTVERGLTRFDEPQGRFVNILKDDLTTALIPDGHAVPVPAANPDYLYFIFGGKLARCSHTFEAVKDRAAYEGYTCLETTDKFSSTTARVLRNENGQIQWRWVRGAAPIGWDEEEDMVKAGLLKSDERRYHPHNIADNKPFQPHANHIMYNDYLEKWIMVVCERMGSSMLGEIWYMEADRPEGPWNQARKIITHNKYSFYNPVWHPEFSRGQHVYLEGTYTEMFSGAEAPTPLYDYNQVMYRLDLDKVRMDTPR